MKTMNRRDFVKYLGLSSLVYFLHPVDVKANTIQEIVVVGGGFAGATAAKYLKLWGGSSINVTLIEPNTTYVSPILSNLVLNKQKNIENLTFDYISHALNYKTQLSHIKPSCFLV